MHSRQCVYSTDRLSTASWVQEQPAAMVGIKPGSSATRHAAGIRRPEQPAAMVGIKPGSRQFVFLLVQARHAKRLFSLYAVRPAHSPPSPRREREDFHPLLTSVTRPPHALECVHACTAIKSCRQPHGSASDRWLGCEARC